MLDSLGHARLCDFLAATEIGLGCSFIGSPEYAAPDALEDVVNGQYGQFHKASPSDDLFAFGLVILFIISGTLSEDMLHYYAIERMLLCTKETYPMLRDSQKLFARLMRYYYASEDFIMLVKRQHHRLHIEGLRTVMYRLLELQPSARLSLSGLLECDLFKAARQLSAERNAMVIQYKKQACLERERAQQFQYGKEQAEEKAAALEKQIGELREANAKSLVEKKRVSAQLARMQRPASKRTVEKMRLELEQCKSTLKAELEAEKARLENEIKTADENRRRAEQNAIEKANQLEAALAENAQYVSSLSLVNSTLGAAKEHISKLNDQVHVLQVDKERTEIELENLKWFTRAPGVWT